MNKLVPFQHGTPRRVGVIGAGAMGVSLAAVLGQSTEVVVVARDPRRAEHIRQSGAVLHGLADQVAHPRVVRHIDELVGCGPLDAVFVATKTTSIDEVSKELKPHLNTLNGLPQGPWIISFQNGIETGRVLSERLANGRVIRMVLNYGARLDDNGNVEVVQSKPPHAIGAPTPGCFEAACALARLLTVGGMQTEPVEDIEPLVWIKGITNASMNPVAALVNAGVGEVLDSPAVSIVARLIAEGIRVAQAEEIDLGSDIEDRIWNALECARAHTPSMVEDIRAGRSSEVDQLNRQIIEHARSGGIDAPTHELITALIETFDWRVFHRLEHDHTPLSA